jgi:hypothetical protein
MIDEGRVHAGELDAQHVARDAILRRGRAGFTRMVLRGFLGTRRYMASEARPVARAGIMIQLLMRG